MPAPQPLATVEQLGHLLRADLDADDPTARMLLGWASGLVRGYLGQHITLVQGDVEYVTPVDGRLQLLQLPVRAVTLVEAHDLTDGTWTPLDAADWTVDLVRGSVGASVYPYWPTGWPQHAGSFRVTYDHGLDEVPDDIAGAAASIAARLYNTPPGILNERNGQRGATFRAEEFLTPIERMTLGQYREARIA